MTDKQLPIYLVTIRGGSGERTRRLVRAKSRAQAFDWVAQDVMTSDRATQDQCFDLAAAGVKIEQAAPGGEGGAA